jgi:hypothetical protein
MPTVTLTLRSQRSKPVPDRVEFIELRGRSSGPVIAADMDLRPGEIVLDLVPDSYTIALEIGGFKPIKGKFDVGTQALARTPSTRLASRDRPRPPVHPAVPDRTKEALSRGGCSVQASVALLQATGDLVRTRRSPSTATTCGRTNL